MSDFMDLEYHGMMSKATIADLEAQAMHAWQKREHDMDIAEQMAENARREEKTWLIGRINSERCAAADQLAASDFDEMAPIDLIVGYTTHAAWYFKRTYAARTESRPARRICREESRTKHHYLLLDGTLITWRSSSQGELGKGSPPLCGLLPMVLQDESNSDLRYILKQLEAII